jgi:predicted ester cyclase
MFEARRASDRNKAIMQRFYDEVVNGGDIDAIDELLSADFKEYEEAPGFPPDREGVKQFFAMLRAAFPDVHFAVEEMLAEGDLVAAHVKITGTHTGGEFMGIPAGGRSVDFQAMDLVRLADGVATAHWGVTDMVAMLTQLGAMPEPG